MTSQEFSNEFDILYNNIMSNQAPGLDEYEKSVFLTMAQEDIVKQFYKGSNSAGGPFDGDEETKRALGVLVIMRQPQSAELSTRGNQILQARILPEDTWFIVQEYVVFNDKIIDVVPVTHDELQKLKKNPFRGISNNRILRLDIGDGSNQQKLMLIASKDFFTEEEVGEFRYYITYIRKPYPIILTQLEEGLTIDKQTTDIADNPCELSSSIHRLILTRAVQLAAAAYKS